MKIIVTDLTRFSTREIVCLAGIELDTGKCVRPLLGDKNHQKYIQFKTVKELKILPGSVLEADMTPINSDVYPHNEDHLIIGKCSVHPQISSSAFHALLDKSCSRSLKEAFGRPPTNKCYLSTDQAPQKSIITLKLDPTRFEIRRDNFGKFKAFFKDDLHAYDYVAITDLGFSDHLQGIADADPGLLQLNSFIRDQKELYARVGLSREHDASGRKGWWIQLNGVYTFPNYRTDCRVYDY